MEAYRNLLTILHIVVFLLSSRGLSLLTIPQSSGLTSRTIGIESLIQDSPKAFDEDSFFASSSPSEAEFKSDCADPHNTQIRCSVHAAACSRNGGLRWAATGQEPPEVHDLRVDSYSKVLITPGAQLQESNYVLHVGISWQLPPGNNSYRLQAFLLEVVDAAVTRCFLFNVTDFTWSANSSNPRFHFSTESIFNFAEMYTVTVRSLPASITHSPLATKNVTMVANPGNLRLGSDDNETCLTQANPQAAKWTAGFRRIFLHAIARTIQIQFVAAPPSMCFEAYEVRLLDSQGLEVEYSHVIYAAELKTEVTDAGSFFIGEHNFTDLQVDMDYIPSVMPVERAEDGRCLCPIEQSPNDRYTVCSCIAADWKRVRLHRTPQQTSAMNFTTVAPPLKDEVEEGVTWIHGLLLMILLIFLGICIIIIAALSLRRYKKREKMGRTRIDVEKRGMTMSASQPLIPGKQLLLASSSRISLLLVYSHDCPLHEATVIAFAEYLRNAFNINVHLDEWEREEISRNLHDYINASVVQVDKVLIINSVGAYARMQARERLQKLERIGGGPLDDLFEAQIDLAMQHARVISMRFSYTPAAAVLFSLSPVLQYSIPENMPVMLAAITEATASHDPRLLVSTGGTGFDPALQRLRDAITRMQNYAYADPDWFEHLYERTARAMKPVFAFPALHGPPLMRMPWEPQVSLSHQTPWPVVPVQIEREEVAEEPECEAGESSELLPVEVPIELLPVSKEVDEGATTSAGDSAYLSGTHPEDEEEEEQGHSITEDEELLRSNRGEEADEDVDSGKDGCSAASTEEDVHGENHNKIMNATPLAELEDAPPNLINKKAVQNGGYAQDSGVITLDSISDQIRY